MPTRGWIFDRVTTPASSAFSDGDLHHLHAAFAAFVGDGHRHLVHVVLVGVRRLLVVRLRLELEGGAAAPPVTVNLLSSGPAVAQVAVLTALVSLI